MALTVKEAAAALGVSESTVALKRVGAMGKGKYLSPGPLLKNGWREGSRLENDAKICPIMSRPVYNGKFLELYVVHCYGAQCKLYSTCDKSTGPVAIKNVTPVPGL